LTINGKNYRNASRRSYYVGQEINTLWCMDVWKKS